MSVCGMAPISCAWRLSSRIATLTNVRARPRSIESGIQSSCAGGSESAKALSTSLSCVARKTPAHSISSFGSTLPRRYRTTSSTGRMRAMWWQMSGARLSCSTNGRRRARSPFLTANAPSVLRGDPHLMVLTSTPTLLRASRMATQKRSSGGSVSGGGISIEFPSISTATRRRRSEGVSPIKRGQKFQRIASTNLPPTSCGSVDGRSGSTIMREVPLRPGGRSGSPRASANLAAFLSRRGSTKPCASACPHQCLPVNRVNIASPSGRSNVGPKCAPIRRLAPAPPVATRESINTVAHRLTPYKATLPNP